MWRAVIFLALALSIVLSSLMLLRRTAGDRGAKRQGDRPPPRIELQDDDDP
jgi:hypothetical protein